MGLPEQCSVIRICCLFQPCLDSVDGTKVKCPVTGGNGCRGQF